MHTLKHVHLAKWIRHFFCNLSFGSISDCAKSTSQQYQQMDVLMLCNSMKCSLGMSLLICTKRWPTSNKKNHWRRVHSPSKSSNSWILCCNRLKHWIMTHTVTKTSNTVDSKSLWSIVIKAAYSKHLLCCTVWRGPHSTVTVRHKSMPGNHVHVILHLYMTTFGISRHLNLNTCKNVYQALVSLSLASEYQVIDNLELKYHI